MAMYLTPNKFPILFFLSLVANIGLKAQEKTVHKQNLQWPQYYNQIILNDQYSVLSDVGYRFRNFFEESSQYIIRTGVAKKLGKNSRIAIGFANLGFFRDGEMTRIEYRPYQEIQFKKQYNLLSINQRFRIEERFFQQIENNELLPGKDFNWRFRYLIALKYPIIQYISNGNQQNISIIIANELLLNAGKSIVYNHFDQNRLQIGLSYRLNKDLSLSLLYSHHYVAKNRPHEFRRDAVAWFRIKHRIDLRRND